MTSRGNKNGVRRHHGERPEGARAAAAPAASGTLDVARLLAGRRLLMTGTTGFVGKVALSMLLDRYPGVGKVFVLIRPGTGGTAEARFFGKVAEGRPFDPLRARLGEGYQAFMREKVVPLAGDVSDPLLGLSEADVAQLTGLDLVLNSAGLVDFDPSLELALGVNVHGPRNAVELCARLGAGLLHVSTCFVAGNRDGVIFEDEPVLGYFPRRTGVVAGRTKQGELSPVDFDVASELADAERRIAEVRAQAEDHVQQSRFREGALLRLRHEGRPVEDEKALRMAMGRERRLWLSKRLVEVGMERARHWGWPNTYTYTKSMGEQVIAASDLPWAIVRPSIVESAWRYPFPGWNEGFTTSAPLAFMGLKGHRTFPTAEKSILDVVPVDLIVAGELAAAAELLERRDKLRREPTASGTPLGAVYHLASGDVNPLWTRRSVELTALYRRRFYRDREEGNPTWNRVLSRIEPQSVSRAHYEGLSSPALAALARGARKLIQDHGPRWGAPRLSALLHGVEQELDEWTRRLEQTKAMWDLYLPFVWENNYVFRCAAVRALRDRLSPEDRARLPWDPEALDWRRYWMEVHMKGMEEWVFPGLEEEVGKKVHAPRAHRDLLELLDAACERWKGRTAFRMTGAGTVKERFTYDDLRRLSGRVAAHLAAAGVKKGDRVLLASENRPEWPIAFFGILRLGAVAVPVDHQLSEAALSNLWAASGARLALVSDAVLERVPGCAASVPGARAVLIGEALQGGGAGSADLPDLSARRVAPEDLASLIFTSGTTGTPKGVMLSHRNFASLVAKLATVFDLGPGDGLLSVLPLHHTFEFSCGLLLPLSRGSEIEYLDELTSDTIGDALGSGRVTAMIGVPALWSLLHRRITQELAAKPGVVERAFDALRKGNGALRDSSLGWNLGKALLWPVHRKLGGRLRYLVSGGSALDPAVQEAFRELGFDLYEGYGLTEAAPVLTVSKPSADAPRGSVGPPLPGVELRIADPDAAGVGEVLAKGANVMTGYWRGGEQPGVDDALTGEVKEGDWLRTGDLGRLDAEGNLTLVGRMKDVIIDANGKNVYPDEVEERYAKAGLVKELCAVGLPDGTAEKVALLVVPDYGDRPRAEVRAAVEAHLREVSASLPFAQRAKIWHLWDAELPRTATRKVKRAPVRDELVRLEAATAHGRRARDERGAGEGWVLDLLAEVSRRPRAGVGRTSRLEADLGFDSLMRTELSAALEEAGVSAQVADQLHAVHTVDDLLQLVAGSARRGEGRAPAALPAPEKKEREEIAVPAPLARLGRRLLSAGQRALYEEFYDTKVIGAAFVPRDRNVLVVANHSSHLDMGLVKIALGGEGARLAALAARDYFFDTAVKRAYFENFTNLIPMDRAGSLRTSLRAAVETLRRGYHLLIFPEGTRSRDGEVHAFFPTAGYLALTCGVDVLPIHLSGTFDALPAGRTLPRRAALEVRIGQPIPVETLRRAGGEGHARGEAYRAAAQAMEDAVRALRAESLAGKAGRQGPPRAEASPTPAADGAGAPAHHDGGARAAPAPGKPVTAEEP
jgi:long-chain acyl-CoA synthetase